MIIRTLVCKSLHVLVSGQTKVAQAFDNFYEKYDLYERGWKLTEKLYAKLGIPLVIPRPTATMRASYYHQAEVLMHCMVDSVAATTELEKKIVEVSMNEALEQFGATMIVLMGREAAEQEAAS